MNEQHHRPIRSFVRREGKITKSQKLALTELLPQFGIELQDEQAIDIKEVFGRLAPVYIEIGFGDGDALYQLAKANPDCNYIGIEVYRPGVGALLNKISDNNLSNIRVITDDAAEVFKKHLNDACLDGVMLFFPDPWHKKKHQKRRIVQPGFTEIVAKKLKNDGKWYMATDWEDYALQMLEVLSSCTQLRNADPSGKFTKRPTMRAETKFEKRGKRLGHEVWDLVFIKPGVIKHREE